MSRPSVAFVLSVVIGLGFTTGPGAQQTVVVTDTPRELLFELYDRAAWNGLGMGLLVVDILGYPGLPRDLNSKLTNDLLTPAIMTAAIGTQLSTLPLGSSAGGFTYSFDSSTGAFNPASDSFGPLFAERALTLGRNRFNAGVNYQRATFDTFQGKNLRDGGVQFFSELFSGLDGGVPFLYSSNTLNLELSTHTIGFFATYGALDNLDIGIAVPVVSIDVKASLLHQLFFYDGEQLLDDLIFQGNASASGIGDVTVRAKYKVFDLAGGGVAAAVDLRLPTGNEENLLGASGTRAKMFLIMSTAVGRYAPHVNVGYTFSSGEYQIGDESNIAFFQGFEQSDEFNLSGGVDVAIAPQVTIAGDILLRTLRNFPELRTGASEVGSAFPEFIADFDYDAEGYLKGDTQGYNQYLSYGSIGAKINPWSTLIFSANVLFPLVKTGLQDNFMPMLGGDFTF